MRAEEHQSQWFSFGGVLFGGGVVVSADWIFAVKSAAQQNHLSFLDWPIWLSFIIMAMGIYAMLASYIDRLPLPGKERVRVAKLQRSVAYGYLTGFHLIGSYLSDEGEREEIADWIANVGDYVRDAWGFPEQAAIISSIEWSEVPENTAIGVNERLTSLIQRCGPLAVPV
jgi:hypothetical protein